MILRSPRSVDAVNHVRRFDNLDSSRNRLCDQTDWAEKTGSSLARKNVNGRRGRAQPGREGIEYGNTNGIRSGTHGVRYVESPRRAKAFPDGSTVDFHFDCPTHFPEIKDQTPIGDPLECKILHIGDSS